MSKMNRRILVILMVILMTAGTLSCSTLKGVERKEVITAPVEKEEGVRANRKEAKEHFRIAQNHLKGGDLDKAEREIKIVLSLDPNEPVPHLLSGDIHYARGELEKALTEYERAKALDERKALPHVKIARIYKKSGEYEKALEAYREAVSLDPEIPGLHRELGDLYKKMGLEDEARREYSRAQDLLHSNKEEASKEKVPPTRKGRRERLEPALKKIMQLGDEFSKQGFSSLAIQEYMIAVRLKPDSVIVHQKLGDAYSRKGMLDEATGQYERVMELDPDSPLGYLGLGVVNVRMFRFKKAISLFNKGISLAPDFPPLYFELAIAYSKADRLDDAIASLERTVEIDKERPQPKDLLEKLKQEKAAEEGFVTIENERFVFKYDPRQDKQMVDYVFKSLNEAYEKLMIDMSCEPEEKVVVKLYPDLKSFHRAASTPEWFSGGVASAKDLRILLATPKREVNIKKLPQVITHELTHVFTNFITYGKHPGWIHEGIALYEAGQWDEKKERVLRQAIAEDTLFTLDELERPFTRLKRQRRIQLAYAQSYALVEYILDYYGRDKFFEVLNAFSMGKNFGESAREVFGVGIDAFEERGINFIKKKYG